MYTQTRSDSTEKCFDKKGFSGHGEYFLHCLKEVDPPGDAPPPYRGHVPRPPANGPAIKEITYFCGFPNSRIMSRYFFLTKRHT